MSSDLERTISVLGNTPAVLRALLSQLPEEWLRRNEGDKTWSPFDVVGHLIHGEKTDWIPRARIILSDIDDKTFVPFDRFAQFKESEGKSPEELLEEFETLRTQNLNALRSFNLTERDLSKEGIHPALGSVSLGQLLATWMVHDLDHLAQIIRVIAKQNRQATGPWSKYLSVLEWKNKQVS